MGTRAKGSRMLHLLQNHAGVQVPYLDYRFYTRLLVAPPGSAKICRDGWFRRRHSGYSWPAERASHDRSWRLWPTHPGRPDRGERVTQAFDNLTLSQRVYKHLREEILSDRLPPGTELSEVALSKVLEISRGPIREAMGRLAAEGLITVRPRRRATPRARSPAHPGPATRCLTMPCPAMPQPRWRQEACDDTRSAPGQRPD